MHRILCTEKDKEMFSRLSITDDDARLAAEAQGLITSSREVCMLTEKGKGWYQAHKDEFGE